MDIQSLTNKIIAEGEEPDIAANYAKALLNTPVSFISILERWIKGEQPEYEYNGISLSYIQEKEKCSYYNALLRMQIILESPFFAKGYKTWTPVNKDRRY